MRDVHGMYVKWTYSSASDRENCTEGHYYFGVVSVTLDNWNVTWLKVYTCLNAFPLQGTGQSGLCHSCCANSGIPEFILWRSTPSLSLADYQGHDCLINTTNWVPGVVTLYHGSFCYFMLFTAIHTCSLCLCQGIK